MAQNSKDIDLAAIDFDEVAPASELTKKNVVREVPANILAIAQRVLDGQTRESRSFRGNEAMAIAFESALKDAGNWTNPKSSGTVNRDGVVVTYSFGQRRGRKESKTAKAGNGSDKPAN